LFYIYCFCIKGHSYKIEIIVAITNRYIKKDEATIRRRNSHEASRGKDKAKERYDRNGGYSTKHLRLKENLNKKTKS